MTLPSLNASLSKNVKQYMTAIVLDSFNNHPIYIITKTGNHIDASSFIVVWKLHAFSSPVSVLLVLSSISKKRCRVPIIYYIFTFSTGLVQIILNVKIAFASPTTWLSSQSPSYPATPSNVQISGLLLA